jgi:polyphosphate glucokinase
MNILVVDIGGTNVKVLVSGHADRRKIPSGPRLTPDQLVSEVTELVKDWPYDVVSIGFPGRVRDGRIVSEPKNLGPGWVGFDFERAFGCPVKLVNDADLQALGSYHGGVLLFLGLGTGVGSSLIVNGTFVPLEIGHLAYRNGTYEDYVGKRGRKRVGTKKWQKYVEAGVARLVDSLHPDEVVIGGGEVKKLIRLPRGCIAGNNENAFVGGYRLWGEPARASSTTSRESSPR